MKAYTSYRKYSAEYDTQTHELRVCFAGHGGFFTARIDEVYHGDRRAFDLDDYKMSSVSALTLFDRQVLSIQYSGGPEEQETFGINVTLMATGVYYRMSILGHFDVRFSGFISYGEPGRPVCFDNRGMTLRAGLGPAACAIDDALFDVATDSALRVTGPAFVMKYNWREGCFSHTMSTGGDDIVRDFSLRLIDNVYSDRFGVAYAPMNHATCFSRPPVGWMTWYAVQFGACEKAVLDNARFQKEKLAPYGANAIWVDWEWYHRDFTGTHRPGVDVFNPDTQRYPNGLKHVADEIIALGFVPALWIGATNDPNENEFLRENPDALLIKKREWCGQYFIDPTHPKVLSEYIPRVFSMIRDMGYRAIKWDCLPISFERIDASHDELRDSSLSTDEAMRGIVKIARETVGSDTYMLSCSGETSRDILFACDMFDAARVGGDIFRWSEFVTSGIERILKLYHYHNTILYTDPDNVVIRPEYNTFDQAVSRVSIVSMLGLPFTMGDELTGLDEGRLELIRRAIPVMDIHPMDIRENFSHGRAVVINLAVATEWEDWNVVDAVNLLETENRVHISLFGDLNLHAGKADRYLLFDFWEHRYLGETGEGFDIELAPCASRVICVRKKTGFVQLLSTTRHITQGALEMEQVGYDVETGVLSGIANVVPGDDYSIFIYAPAGMRPSCESNSANVNTIERADDAADCESGCVWKLTLARAGGPTPWSAAFAPV